MADVQAQFRQFHEEIKLLDLDDNDTLREKRDALIDKLRRGLARVFEERGQTAPSFDTRNLGSYAMGTGVKPHGDRDFDIDVGLYFNISAADHAPVALKKIIFDELNTHPHTAQMQHPCVTVCYTRDGRDAYHVDFAIHAAPEGPSGLTYIAKGMPGSDAVDKKWEPSGSLELVQKVKSHLAGDDHLQFRRVIQYLKRWKDVQFSPTGERAPRGIGLTLAALEWFRPHQQDLVALEQLVAAILAGFTSRRHEGETVPRLSLKMPVPPYDDPFERMTNKRMAALRACLEELKTALVSARSAEDLVVACKTLRGVFGDDFPIPDAPKSA